MVAILWLIQERRCTGMRDRLIELVGKELLNYASWHTEMALAGNYDMPSVEEVITDKILADGWFRPPCKVGDIFYGLNETEYDDYEVLGFKWGKRRGDDEYVLIVLTVYDMEFVWGEEAFLTKEEAEQTLKGAKQ